MDPSTTPVDDRVRAIRSTIVRMSHDARSAHLGSSLSAVELLDAFVELSDLRTDTVEAPVRDRIVVSKGHAAMAWYATLAEWNLLPKDYLSTYLQNGSPLWGHVTRTKQVPAIDASTGSLGHGLSLATGFALAARLQGTGVRAFALLSDGECDEGSTWEAIAFAGHHKLGNLVAAVDYNKIQSIGRCDDVLSKEPFDTRFEAFGWTAKRVDGHDPAAIREAIASHDGARPLALLADTVKGKGLPRMEDTVWCHYKPALPEDVEAYTP